MDIDAISGAATVALASAILFLLVAKSWSALSRNVGSTPNFADSIMHEAAQRFRDELDRLSSSQAIYLSSTLVFLVLFAAAYILQARDLFAGYPSWQLWLQIASFPWRPPRRLAPRPYDPGTSPCEVRARRERRRSVISCNKSQPAPTGYFMTSDERRHRRSRTRRADRHLRDQCRRTSWHQERDAVLSGHELSFSNSDYAIPIVDITASTARLEKEICQLLGHKIRVRSVIAVPGWDIGEQASERHLLVNERTIAMLRGWKDQSDYLMNEDVALLQKNSRRAAVAGSALTALALRASWSWRCASANCLSRLVQVGRCLLVITIRRRRPDAVNVAFAGGKTAHDVRIGLQAEQVHHAACAHRQTAADRPAA